MRKPQLPPAVTWFETLSIVLLVIELVFVSGLTWDDAVWVPIMGWIVIAITRGKNPNARLLLTGFFALGFLLLAGFIVQGMIALTDIAWTGWMMTIAAIVQLALLWSPAMSQWLLPTADGNSQAGVR